MQKKEKPNMKRIWKVFCMDDSYPGMWQRWFKNQCIAVGWPPGDGFHLHGKTLGGNGWSRVRNSIQSMSIGDYVVVSMKDGKIARVGEITEKLIEDEKWNPLVPRSKSLPDGEMGRRILVRWNMAVGPTNPDHVIQLPTDLRFTNGELRPTVSKIQSKSIQDILKIMNNMENWVGLLSKFAYETSLSDYIANYPHHLEDGLTPYPNSKIREKIFKDRTRLDVLLIDRNEAPVIVECKQHSPSKHDIEQLKGYIKNLFEETSQHARGILVHSGSPKLSPKISDILKREKNIEVLSYNLSVDFKRSY